MIFLGCDGGSTKTELLLADEKGNLLARYYTTGCNYGYLGDIGFENLFRTAFDTLFKGLEISINDVTFTALGMPAYGEIEETELFIPEILSKLLPSNRMHIVNDAVVGWCGSLSARPGINIVSGTGSISYGADPNGSEMRVGGWSLMFCDEGSCSWIGRQALRHFTMQCDGRLPRTVLYDLFKKRFSLTSKDIYFSKILMEVPNDSALLAEMQFIALDAYRQGDITMLQYYEKAAELLVDTAIAIRAHLAFPKDKPVQVSYSGGLFRAGDVICIPFINRLEENGFLPVKPEYPPSIGSLALAASTFLDSCQLNSMLENAYRMYLQKV